MYRNISCLPKKRFILIFTGIIFTLLVAVTTSFGAPHSKARKEIRLVMATYTPINYDPYLFPGQKLLVNMFNERGKGIVNVDMYWGGTLLSSKQLLPGLQAGTADLIILPGAYLLGSFPIVGIQNLPVWKTLMGSFEANKTGTPLAKMRNETLKKKIIMQLASTGIIPEFLWTKNKPVQTPEDIKGLRIRAPGKIEAKVIHALGGVPVTMPSAEVPQALQRGIIDGVLMNLWTARSRNVEEYCRYVLIQPLSGISTPVFVLLNKWNNWPDDVRNVLREVTIEWENRMIGPLGAQMTDKQMSDELIPYYEKKGVKAMYPTEENIRAFEQATKPVVDWWVKKVGKEIGRKMLQYTNK